MQHVELDEGPAAGTDFLHRRLIERAPRIGESEPVELVAARAQDTFGFTRDSRAPIHHRAEDVVEERFGHHL